MVQVHICLPTSIEDSQNSKSPSTEYYMYSTLQIIVSVKYKSYVGIKMWGYIYRPL